MFVAPTASRWKFGEVDWDKVSEEVGEEKERRRGEWEKTVTNREWDRLATILTEVIQTGIKKGVPIARPTWLSEKWFDEEVKEKRRQLASFQRWKRVRTEGEREEAEEEGRRRRNEYFRLIREKKSGMWNKFVHEVEGRQMWGVWKMASTKRTTKMPTIIDPMDNTTHTTFEEKEQIFHNKLFPQSRVREGEHQETERGSEEVMENEAYQAIKAQGQMKAPGEDEIPAIAIIKTWGKLGEWITKAYRGMLEDGYHPEQWRRAVVAVIPKPNKANYDTPKRYRPISRLATLGKGLERIVAAKLMKIGEGPKGLHRDQWGGRKGRSAETCIGHLVDRIAKAQEKGKKVSIIAMDGAQAFPSVDRNNLANALREDEVTENLIKWVRSFMSGRKVSIKFDGEQ